MDSYWPVITPTIKKNKEKKRRDEEQRKKWKSFSCPCVTHSQLSSSVDRTLNKSSDTVSGSHLPHWHGRVSLRVYARVPPLWLLGDEDVSPAQHLSSCWLRRIHTQLLVTKKINKEIMPFKPRLLSHPVGSIARRVCA